MENKIDLIGNLTTGHDGELYIITDDNVEHDISNELHELEWLKYLGDKIRVRLVIEKQ